MEALLEGNVTVKALQKATDLPPEAVREILDHPEFQKLYLDARRSMSTSAVERLERKAHIHIRNIENLTSNDDPRVRLEANRDLLNRTPGLQPGAKVELGTTAWRKLAEKYFEKEEPEK